MTTSRSASDDEPDEALTPPGNKRKLRHGSPERANKKTKIKKEGDASKFPKNEVNGKNHPRRSQRISNSGRKGNSKPETEEEEGTSSEKEESSSPEVKEEEDKSPETGESSPPEMKEEEDKPSEKTDTTLEIMEKGILYFFIRGRVEVDRPDGVDDIARSYMLLRPIDDDAELNKGQLDDHGNARLVVLPKKTFPRSPKDRFMAFVEMSGGSLDEIKQKFLASSEYETKTVGTRHTPAATPLGEGIYAITSTGRDSHFAYFLTLPQKIEEAQKKLGLKDRGSFILSTKNPQYPGPANTRLPKSPEFPKEIHDQFRSRRWMPSKPDHLNYVNAQLLLIGEPAGIDKAVKSKEGDEEREKELKEKLEDMNEEDYERMHHLGKDDSERIFADLEAQAKEYSKILTKF